MGVNSNCKRVLDDNCYLQTIVHNPFSHLYALPLVQLRIHLFLHALIVMYKKTSKAVLPWMLMVRRTPTYLLALEFLCLIHEQSQSIPARFFPRLRTPPDNSLHLP